eukprot:3230939-Alexandrium_andersonii.AAC.1
MFEVLADWNRMHLASLHRQGPKVRSAICARPVSAAFRLNLQSTLRKMRNSFKRSNLEMARARGRPQLWPPKLPR